MARFHRVTNNKDVTKFDGTYFNVWKHCITLLFKAKRFWPIVEGTESKSIASIIVEAQALLSTSKGSIAKREDREALALSIINNCLEIPLSLIFNIVNHHPMHGSNFVICMRQKI